MQGTDVRHVHTVRLRAPEARFVQRGTTLLEDALRTASVPGAADGRVLCIRSLAVGVIRPGQSAASLALTIEGQLQHLRTRAVHALAPGAARHPAVYFRDEFEPYVLLALRLASGQPAAEWFWPTVVPTWKPGLPPAEALRCVAFGSLQTPAGVAAAARIVRELYEAQTLTPLCTALQPSDGPMLLQACGWTASPTAPPEPTPTEMPLPSGWTKLIRQWARRWGAMAPRTLWLVAMGAIIQHPLRLLDPQLMQCAQRVAVQATQSFDAETPQARATPIRHAEGGQQTDSDAETVVDETAQTGGTPQAEKAAFMAQTRSLSPLTSAEPVTHPANASPQRHPELWKERGTPAASTKTMLDHDEPEMATTSTTIRDDHERIMAAVQPTAPPDPTAVPNRRTSPPLTHNPAYQTEIARQERTWPTEPQPTAYAGLFFLISALERLGIAEFLTSHPHWIECDLPWRLLQHICTALAVSDDDPILAALPSAHDTTAAPVSGFVAPDHWRQTGCVSPPWQLSRVVSHRGRRVLCDASGRLPVAAWRGAAPEAAHPFVDGQPIHKHALHPLPQRLTAELDAVVLHAWHTVLRRWCRRHAGMGLATMVHRPGRIMWTPTHIDLVFRHADTDVRIRRAGLDLILGWVPWLGRVVTFHYVEKEV